MTHEQCRIRRRESLRLTLAGHTQAEVAQAVGVDRATVSRDLTRLCARYPGLDHALAVCRSVHEVESREA